jgi:hypothetical protein
VGDHHDGVPLVVELAEQIHDLGGRERVEVAGRLVGEDHPRVGDECTRDRHALLLTARQLVGQVVPPLAEPHSFQRGTGAAPAVVGARVDERQLHVGLRVRARDEVEGLENESDPGAADPGELVLRERADIGPVEAVDAGRGQVHATEDVHERGLARPGRTHDRHELALGDREVDVVERVHLDGTGAVDLRNGL